MWAPFQVTRENKENNATFKGARNVDSSANDESAHMNLK
jgi:hypothetical protein